MNRFFTMPENIGDERLKITDKDDLYHISRVLRLKPGDKIEVSDYTKWEYVAEITNIYEDFVEGLILDKQSFANEPFINVTLFQGIPKQGKMEIIIQKCVELGTFEIVPVFMKRTVVEDKKGNFSKKIQRWQKVSDEAVKQCKRGIVPEICDEIKFDLMIERLKDFDLVLFPYENEEKTTIKDVLKFKKNSNPKSIAVIIGPEGGFSDEEAEKVKHAGGNCVSLGKTTLRTETAGPTALAMIMYEYEL